MAQTQKIPGIYIEEKNAFPNAVVEVATAVPAFIGYTEKALHNGKSLLNRPTRITSLSDYMAFFGAGFHPTFKLESPQGGDNRKLMLGAAEMAIKFAPHNQLIFFDSIRLFYANGGGTCYIVSVGTYEGKDSLEIQKDQLLGQGKDEKGNPIDGGLRSLEKEQEPTMVVIPEAVLLGEDCYEVYREVLAHCSQMQNRIGIFDLFDGFKNKGGDDPIDLFRVSIGTDFLSYGTAYYPWLHTTIVQQGKLSFKNLDPEIDLESILPEPKAKKLLREFPKDEAHFRTVFQKKQPHISQSAEVDFDDFLNSKKDELHKGLLATSPTYTSILEEMRGKMNLLPAAAALAGIYTMVDNTVGVWKSPANVSLNAVIRPAVEISQEAQEDLNVHISGKSINAIRTFAGIGTLVWGARTLDGNSLDWRYINVRRTVLMFEQSIKLALEAYVFEPNESNTWTSVKSMIVNFLTNKWKQGALAGASPEEAFDVQIGLGVTMTGLDVLEGRMLVSVKLAIVKPAEFIVLTFEQQMQKP
ncbi:Phage tail sheath protein FI [Mariniradius saccharolyticus AK6]|uniref:Phage tail sheath protein FI n=1 Tax=Mariniradius saccharolyticus AK6 TaxID=1239962 RepID=M7XAB0_9BACT|nr:phage tail sheath C-terminal domain-containing protein [Mariniradius saccharolyticus]EMS34350.1 Phage tail sheath protein FI [Mariniradius saccharolyticus AK6]